MTDTCLLTLIAAPSLEETLIDWLLTQENISGFSSFEMSGHGVRSARLSIVEQVTGRQKRIQFQIHTDLEMAHQMIETLKLTYPNAGLRYLLTPVLAMGQI